MQICILGKDLRPGGLFFVALMMSLFGPVSLSAKAEKHPGSALDTIPLTRDTSSLMRQALAARTFTIIGVGDMMLGTNYPKAAHLPPNGGRDLLVDVEELLRSADVTFGNLEGTILDEGGTAKRCGNPDACYVFRSPESYVQHFEHAGFDLLSLANNHSGDFGAEGRLTTKARLDEVGIAYAGLAGSDESTVIYRNGLKVGLCAFAPNRGTCDIRNIPRAKAIVEALSQTCDVVIVSFHGGAEGNKHQRVPRRTETYYGEDRGNVYAFSHAVIDAGADIVFGHGPHVTRAMELYKNRLICYSLGNFCTYGRFNLRGVNGIAPIVSIDIDAMGNFLGGKITPIYQGYNHGPKPDPRGRVLDKLRELNRLDFPDTAPDIAEDGTLSASQG